VPNQNTLNQTTVSHTKACITKFFMCKQTREHSMTKANGHHLIFWTPSDILKKHSIWEALFASSGKEAPKLVGPLDQASQWAPYKQ
jgi:hypothetical protein